MRKGILMGTMLLMLVVAGCLPSIAYLCFQALRRFKVRLGHVLPGEGLTQMALATIAAFCFGTGLILVILPFIGQIPYYKQEKGLIVALLFLLMGVLALQVMQFIRTQVRALHPRPDRSPRPGSRRPQRRKRTVARSYAVSEGNR
ncbi:MAG: hypothetical protein FVQ81_09450 [Candidatus Glassbacteria bacterium]|nr:hypothetical protein [Candidatus Glassbacteria bacterium]